MFRHEIPAVGHANHKLKLSSRPWQRSVDRLASGGYFEPGAPPAGLSTTPRRGSGLAGDWRERTQPRPRV